MQNALALAAAADRGEDITQQATPATAPTPAPAPASPDDSDTPADTGEAQPAAQESTPAPKPETTAKTAPEKTTEPKPDSAYTKATKEKARRDDSWKAINAEKERLAAERAHLDQERSRQSQAQQATEARRSAAPAQYTAEEYEGAARKLDSEGNYELADQARAEAARMRSTPSAPEQQTQQAQPVDQQQFLGAWQANLAMLQQSEPDLQNPASDLHKATSEALQKYPLLSKYPSGIRDAVEAAKVTLQARRVPALEKELAAKKAELERLNKTNSLRGGPPGMPPGQAKRFEDMSLEEATAYAQRMAAESDARG